MALAAGQTGHLADHQEGVYTVVHGATAGTARPTLGSSSTSPTVVLWVGSVEPSNAVNNDLWMDTTSGSPNSKVKVSGSFVTAGSGTYVKADAPVDLPAGTAALSVGSPTLNRIGRAPAVLLDDTTTEGVNLSFHVDERLASWTTYNVVAVVAPVGSGGGDIRVDTDVQTTAAGGTYGASATVALTSTIDAVASERHDVTMQSGLTMPAEGTDVGILFRRIASDGADTLVGDLALVRILIQKAS